MPEGPPDGAVIYLRRETEVVPNYRTLDAEQIDTIIACAPERARRTDWAGVVESAVRVSLLEGKLTPFRPFFTCGQMADLKVVAAISDWPSLRL
jgi:hypothetical protein